MQANAARALMSWHLDFPSFFQANHSGHVCSMRSGVNRAQNVQRLTETFSEFFSEDPRPRWEAKGWEPNSV